jgi:hypothetical protein
MPADSDPAATRSDDAGGGLPFTFRPLGARVATAAAAAAIVFIVTFLWVLLPGDVQDDFTVSQRITMIGFFVVILVLLNGIFRTCARATDQGLQVVNGYRRHDLEWSQIVRVSLTPNRPWALMDLDDGTTMSVMAIQSADGARARRAAHRLAVLVARRTRTDRDT